ncbi:flippase [Empedobacter brevis]|uniref:flippase n=1 Tax=Empedobacter brevis TaxID=247 RepID=UPI0016272FC4|nr:flippase [Empedobacter brevis]
MDTNFIKNKITQKFKNKSSKTLLINFISLSILQILNVLLPFLTIPYLIGIVGLKLFGLITFSYSFAFFFQIIVEYGFNTIGARDISINAKNYKRLNMIFSDIFYTKILLLICSLIVYLIIIFSFNPFKLNSTLYIIQFGCVFGQALFPIWLFHGLQRMKYITYINIFFKTFFTLLIFILVKQPEDYWLAPLCTALGLISSGIISLIIVYKKFHISFVKTSINRIKKQLNHGFYVFISEVQIAAIANGNILILGFFGGNQAVGIYSAAEKIVRAIGNLQAPLINTLYPYVSKEMQINKRNILNQLNKFKLYSSIILTIICLVLFIFTPFLFNLIYGNNHENSVIVFRIIILFPLLSFFDQFYGKLILLTNNDEKNFMKVFFISSIFSVILSSILSYYYSFIGMAIANLAVQFFIVLGMYYYAKKITNSYE